MKDGRKKWSDAVVAKVMKYAASHGVAAALRKFKVPNSTFYGWTRRPEYQE